MQCQGKSKRTGEQCNGKAIKGRTTCRMHNGNAKRGFALPQTKDGRYSKYLPTRMLARYQQSATDPALLSLREEITLVDSRLADVLTRVDTGESGALWTKARETYKLLQKAMQAGDAAETRNQLSDLDSLLGRGVADWSAWSEIHKLLNQRKALVESERKALLDAHNAMTIDQGMVMVEALIQTVRAHVKDPAALQGISADLSRILGRAPDRRDSTE